MAFASASAQSAPVPGSLLSPFVPRGNREGWAEFTYTTSEYTIQAYPNPFSDQLTIGFIPKETGMATVEMFNKHVQKMSLLFERQVESDISQQIELKDLGVETGYLPDSID